MVISIRNLYKSFEENGRRNEVLCGLNLEVSKGEIFALMGPNGSGKTTLLKILSTLVSADSGSVCVNGCDISTSPQKVRSALGLVYDAEKSFYQMLSARDNLLFFGRLYGIPPTLLARRIESLSSMFGFSRWQDVKVSHCSSGARQKLAIIRALIADPSILLFDEPTRSLDEQNKKDVARSISEITASGKYTSIIVTHDKAEADFLAGRTGYLKDGKIITEFL